MSRSTAIILMTSVCTFGVGALLYLYNRPSDAQMKDLSLKPSTQIIRHTSKLTSQVIATIINKGESYKPEMNENFELQAKVTLSFAATKLNYQWILPDGIALQAGETLSGTINIQDWRAPIEIPIQLKNLTLKNKKIFMRLSVSGPNQTDQIASAQYDTQNYLELKQEQEDIMKRQEEYLQNLPDESKNFK